MFNFGKFTAQKMKFSIKNFFCKYDQICRNLQEFIFCAVFEVKAALKK